MSSNIRLDLLSLQILYLSYSLGTIYFWEVPWLRAGSWLVKLNGKSQNFYSVLRPHLRAKGCRINVADVKVRVNPASVYFYPDLLVSCDPQDVIAREAIESPMVIVEVLSPSTAAKDRSEKFARYRSIPSLQEYVLIEADRIGVECYRRGEGRMWLYYPYIAGDTIELDSIEFSCPIELLYEGVTFENLA